MKILIAEDEIGIVNFLKQGLEEEGYVVIVANDGKQALELALHETFDLILLDWMMPEMSGLEVCEAFRKKDQTTPIIFLTAKDAVQETILGLNTGANDYIKKPFHFDELLARMEAQLRNARKKPEILEIGTIQINTTSHEVKKGEEIIALTQKEYNLLTFLLENKNQVCERKKIIEEVWDIHFDYNTGVIDVYINALRKKLDLNEENDFIHTIRGVGYIIKE